MAPSRTVPAPTRTASTLQRMLRIIRYPRLIGLALPPKRNPLSSVFIHVYRHVRRVDRIVGTSRAPEQVGVDIFGGQNLRGYKRKALLIDCKAVRPIPRS